MEFPDLGNHCEVDSCRQLDFLPIKCDICSKILCRHHIAYKDHGCEGGKSVQVPVCPLCSKPIPIARGELPDIRVSQHIDRDCKDPAALKKKIYTNECSLKKCKQRELIPVRCSDCRFNFCLKHRHPSDHMCGNLEKLKVQKLGSISKANAAPSTCRQQELHPSLSQDEALAKALQQSMLADGGSMDGHHDIALNQDAALAAAIAQSEREYQQQQMRARQSQRGTTTGQGQRQSSSSNRDGCNIS